MNEDYVPFNIDRARIRGLEAQGGTLIDNWNVQGYLTPCSSRWTGAVTPIVATCCRVAPAWRVQLRVANIFDHGYETAYCYNQPGRSWFLTLRYAPPLN